MICQVISSLCVPFLVFISLWPDMLESQLSRGTVCNLTDADRNVDKQKTRLEEAVSA